MKKEASLLWGKTAAASEFYKLTLTLTFFIFWNEARIEYSTVTCI